MEDKASRLPGRQEERKAARQEGRKAGRQEGRKDGRQKHRDNFIGSNHPISSPPLCGPHERCE